MLDYDQIKNTFCFITVVEFKRFQIFLKHWPQLEKLFQEEFVSEWVVGLGFGFSHFNYSQIAFFVHLFSEE